MQSENPPPYTAHIDSEAQEDLILSPTIFILAGQSIHIETRDNPPTYQLSRGIANLTRITERVTFERYDQIISIIHSSQGVSTPTIKRRPRHLYDLRRTPKQPRIGLRRSRSSSDAPEYYIHSFSRRTLGHVGLRKFSRGGFAAGFSAVPVHFAQNQARCIGQCPALFQLQRKGNQSEWSSVKDKTVVAIEDTADNEHRLIFSKAMPRREVDALVALWCCRIWQEAAARAEAERNGKSIVA